MAPLGLQITTVGGLGGETFMGGDSVLIDECFWEIDQGGLGNCHITPKEQNTVIDLTNDAWDLTASLDASAGHYMPAPALSPKVAASSCFWIMQGDVLFPNTNAKCPAG